MRKPTSDHIYIAASEYREQRQKEEKRKKIAAGNVKQLYQLLADGRLFEHDLAHAKKLSVDEKYLFCRLLEIQDEKSVLMRKKEKDSDKRKSLRDEIKKRESIIEKLLESEGRYVKRIQELENQLQISNEEIDLLWEKMRELERQAKYEKAEGETY